MSFFMETLFGNKQILYSYINNWFLEYFSLWTSEEKKGKKLYTKLLLNLILASNHVHGLCIYL